jgi:hypothetical protein
MCAYPTAWKHVPTLAAVALIGCASNPDVNAICPTSPTASSGAPTMREHGGPPFTPSRAEIPPHQAVMWVLQVIAKETPQGLPPGGDVLGHGSRWQVAETRAGDVPMPSGWPWRCRFNHVEVDQNAAIYRSIRCSIDGWATGAGDTANVWPAEPPSSGSVELRVGDEWLQVEIIPCVNGNMPGCGTAPAPELP